MDTEKGILGLIFVLTGRILETNRPNGPNLEPVYCRIICSRRKVTNRGTPSRESPQTLTNKGFRGNLF